MAFDCPQCSKPGCLAITHSIELPHDVYSDEITLQVLECAGCGFRGIAVYEESRRGDLESESWDHTGYRVDDETITSVVEAIQSCPDPFNPRCLCVSHQVLVHKDSTGRWRLPGINYKNAFRLILR